MIEGENVCSSNKIIIGICDDEKLHRDSIRLLCEKYCKQNVVEYNCIEFISGEEVLNFDGDEIHLLFLDVELGGISGIDVLHKIKNNDKVWRIVFVSSHDECRWDTIGIKTLTYIDKPVTYKAVEKCLQIAIKEKVENVLFMFESEQKNIYLKLDEIYCIEAQKNYVYLHTRNDVKLIFKSMKKCMDMLQNTTMIRIHKSYLINLQHVRNWAGEEVLLTDGKKYPVGRRYSKEAKEQNIAFVQKMAWKRGY